MDVDLIELHGLRLKAKPKVAYRVAVGEDVIQPVIGVVDQVVHLFRGIHSLEEPLQARAIDDRSEGGDPDILHKLEEIAGL